MDAPPISSFSPSERELLAAFLSRSTSQGWSQQRRTVELLLYLSGEKPATEFTQVIRADELDEFDNSRKEGFARLVEAFDLPHKRVAQPLTDDLLAVYYECLPDAETTLPPATGDDPSFHRAWGRHYGYPDSAIEAFIDKSCLRYASDSEDRRRLLNLAEEAGLDRGAVEKLPLVSFLPPNTRDGVRESVAIANHYEAELDELADAHNLPQIRDIVTAVVDRQPRPN